MQYSTVNDFFIMASTMLLPEPVKWKQDRTWLVDRSRETQIIILHIPDKMELGLATLAQAHPKRHHDNPKMAIGKIELEPLCRVRNLALRRLS